MTEYIIIILSVLLGIAGLVIYLSRKELADTREAWDTAVAIAERADERAMMIQHMYDELVSRPAQVLLPMDTVEVIAHHVIKYLSDTEGK